MSTGRYSCQPPVFMSTGRYSCQPPVFMSTGRYSCQPPVFMSTGRYSCQPPVFMSTGRSLRRPNIASPKSSCTPKLHSPPLKCKHALRLNNYTQTTQKSQVISLTGNIRSKGILETIRPFCLKDHYNAWKTCYYSKFYTTDKKSFSETMFCYVVNDNMKEIILKSAQKSCLLGSVSIPLSLCNCLDTK